MMISILQASVFETRYKKARVKLVQGSEEFVTEIAVDDDFKGIGKSIYSVRCMLEAIAHTNRILNVLDYHSHVCLFL